MHCTSVGTRRAVIGAAVIAAALLSTIAAAQSGQASEKGIAEQIFDAMVVDPGVKPGYRVAHAKGIVSEGTFAPSINAASISKALHFQRGPVPVTIRFSDGPADPFIADNSRDAGPRGMGVRFRLPGGALTDVEGISHNGFAVGTGEEFLALLKAAAASDSSRPHPWPIEAFLAAHPRALRFVQETARVPASFATETYFSNNAFIFVNGDGVKRAGRYQFIPVDRAQNLSDAEAKTRPPNFLAEELRTRLARGPVEFRLIVQLANAGDPTNDASLTWPDDRTTVDMGIISIAAIVTDSASVEKGLVFFPTALTDGIELSDDPLPELRTSAYARSFARRQQAIGDSRP
jgi:catalase